MAFPKGNNANPLGPPGRKISVAQIIDRLLGPDAEQAFAALAEIALDREVSTGQRLAALNTLLDRRHGKPVESTVHAVLHARHESLSLDVPKETLILLAKGLPALTATVSSTALPSEEVDAEVAEPEPESIPAETPDIPSDE